MVRIPQNPAAGIHSHAQFVRCSDHPRDAWQNRVFQQRTYWQIFAMGIHTKICGHPVEYVVASLVAKRCHFRASMSVPNAR